MKKAHKQRDNGACVHFPRGPIAHANVDDVHTCAKCGRRFVIKNADKLKTPVLMGCIAIMIVSIALPFLASSYLDKRYYLSEEFGLFPVLKYVATLCLLNVLLWVQTKIVMHCAQLEEYGDDK